MKTLEILSLLIVVFLMQGCSSKSDTAKNEATPETVITDFIESAKSNKPELAKAMCHPDLFEMIAPKSFDELFQEGRQLTQKLESYSISEMSLTDDQASYKVTYSLSDDKQEYDIISLKNENNKWLITDI